MRVAVVCGSYQIFDHTMQDLAHTFDYKSVTKYKSGTWVFDSISFVFVNSREILRGRSFDKYINGYNSHQLKDYGYILTYLEASGAKNWSE